MPLIKHTTIEAVADLDLYDVISRHCELRKHGANYTGCCPFHDEKTPSFHVSIAKGIYKCFGCGKSGANVISFYMEKMACDFPRAIEELANANGIHIDYEEGAAAERIAQETKHKLELIDVNVLANEFFVSQLSSAISYLRCSNAAAEKWELGFAPKSWDNLKKFLHDKGDYYSAAIELGLIKKSDSGKVYDAFRNRLIFPIKDHKNKLVGFSGRTLEEETKQNPKYFNSIESISYNKSNLLFGLNHAKKSIFEKGEATIVEGNWDVVSMHEKNVTNTVAACGTALTKSQLLLLAKETKAKRLLMIYDGDTSGIKACITNATLAMSLGYIVEVLWLPVKEDPQSFFGSFENCFTNHGVEMYIAEKRQNFILWKAAQYNLLSDASEKSNAIKEICQLLAYISDVFLRDEFIDQVLEATNVKKTTLTKAVQTFARDIDRENPENIMHNSLQEDNYDIPKHLTNVIKWRHIRDEVLKYQYFTHDNIIYMRRGSDPYTFQAVSNFSIKIIQHMEDESRPMRLVEITNIHNRKRTFDTSTDDFVTEMGFRKMLEGKGNYNWKAAGSDFSRLCTKLKDDMGDGRMIKILGWQPEGFWAFNNSMILDGKNKFYDANGCFDFAGDSFYVPSGNQIYERNTSKYLQQKNAAFKPSAYTFKEVANQFKIVHRNHSINALLFTVATVFSDLIYAKLDFFPLLFLYGEPSSGKDNLIKGMQSFFGHPQTAISITGKANTDKAKIRKFAQFVNMIGHLTEYANGDEMIDNMIKHLWDRVGYERGNLESAVSTESILITMSIIFTGNDYPTNDALITRFIGEEMNVTTFTPEQKNNYEKLKEMLLSGFSSLLCDILILRPLFESDFRKVFKEVSAELTTVLWDLSLSDRMIQNAAVLGATYKLTYQSLSYPFTWEEFKENIKVVYERQNNKRSTGSVVAHFWECVIESVKDAREPIEQNREFVLDGANITLQFSQIYTRYLKMHYLLYKKNGLSKMVLLDKLQKSDCFVETVSSVRFGKTSKSSGFRFDLSKAKVLEDFMAAIEMAARFRRNPSTNSEDDKKNKGQTEVNLVELENDDKPF